MFWPAEQIMQCRCLCVQMRVIVSGTGDWRYVDCVSSRGGKLQALERVRMLFSVPKGRCVAAGDSGNDILMLEGRLRSAVLGCACTPHAAAPLTSHVCADKLLLQEDSDAARQAPLSKERSPHHVAPLTISMSMEAGLAR